MNKLFSAADILLPVGCDMTKWSLIACDQYTSEPEYWENAKTLSDGVPTTLELILPEVYLEDSETEIPKINGRMRDYLDGVLSEHKDAMIYLCRSIPDGRVREGIVGKVDLEEYDYRAGSTASVRATEQTVIERIPPRVAIRRDAVIELPHIMMLYEDETDELLSGLREKKDNLELSYDFDLMQEAGHLTGYYLDKDSIEYVSDFVEKARAHGMALCVGDGNHSLASAKALYEEIKAEIGEDAAREHPARYALCEIVNIHSSALDFEPIHRLVCDCDVNDLLSFFEENFDQNSPYHTLEYITEKEGGQLRVNKNEAGISVDPLQKLLDEYISLRGVAIDYIHGDDSLKKLSQKQRTIGIFCEPISKQGLFSAVKEGGSLPRKTFSMGVAKEKRHYVEARKIR